MQNLPPRRHAHFCIIALLTLALACSKKSDPEKSTQADGTSTSCKSDAECSASPGQVCDPERKRCVPAPVAPKKPVPVTPSRDPALLECENKPLLKKSAFGPVSQLSGPTRGSSSNQEVHAAVAGDGSLTAAYINRMGKLSDFPATLATITPSGEIEGDKTIGSVRANHYDPWMATDKDGRLHQVWLAFDGKFGPKKEMVIGYSSSDDGKTWPPLRAIQDPNDCAGDEGDCLDKPQLSIGPDKANPGKEALYVVYSTLENQRMIKSTDGGKTWQKSVLASKLTYGDIEVDSAGDVHIVNTSVHPKGDARLGDPKGRIEYVASVDGGATFSQPVTVSRPGKPVPGLFANPQVVSDPKRGSIYVVYPMGVAKTRSWDIVIAHSRDGGKSWSHRKVNDDATCANHGIPDAVLDPESGEVHVMWVENRNGFGQAAYAVCDADKCSANELISDQPFVAYYFKRHNNTWLGEYNKMVIDHERRVLHAVWSQPLDESGIARNRIMHAKRQLPTKP